MSNGTNADPALNKYLIELYFIDKYHWLPQQVESIPYKWVQKYFLIDKYKNLTLEHKKDIQEAQQQIKDSVKQPKLVNQTRTKRR